MEWNIRGGVVEDAAALTKLNREELGYDYPEAKTREHLAALLQDPSHKILVAEIGGAGGGKCLAGCGGRVGQVSGCSGGALGVRGVPERRPRFLPELGLPGEYATAQF